MLQRPIGMGASMRLPTYYRNMTLAAGEPIRTSYCRLSLSGHRQVPILPSTPYSLLPIASLWGTSLLNCSVLLSACCAIYSLHLPKSLFFSPTCLMSGPGTGSGRGGTGRVLGSWDSRNCCPRLWSVPQWSVTTQFDLLVHCGPEWRARG